MNNFGKQELIDYLTTRCLTDLLIEKWVDIEPVSERGIDERETILTALEEGANVDVCIARIEEVCSEEIVDEYPELVQMTVGCLRAIQAISDMR